MPNELGKGVTIETEDVDYDDGYNNNYAQVHAASQYGQSVDLSELDDIEDEGHRNLGNVQKQINTGDQ